MIVSIEQIKANKTNPRNIIPEKLNKLKKSISDFPDMLNKRPLVCFTDKDGKYVVLGGNMRLKACKELGIKELPIILADEWTEEQKNEFIIKDNVGFGVWDWDVLEAEWDLESLQDWGLDIPENWESEEVLEAEEDEDFNAQTPAEPITSLGDIYEIGEHRLLCGDSTDSDQLAKLMNGEKADVAHNDPPYGMKKQNEGVLNDNLNYDDLLEFNKEWIALQFTHLKDNGSWYCWGIDEPLMDIYSHILKPYAKDQKLTFRNLITWDKGNGQGQNSDQTRSYATADEKCLFVMMGVQGFNNNADNYFEGFEPLRKYLANEKEKLGMNNKELTKHLNTSHSHYWTTSQWTFPTEEHYKTLQSLSKGKAFQKEYTKIKQEYDKIKQEYYSTRAYFDNTHDKMTEVWKFDRHKRDGVEGGHATTKPIPLCERVIKSSCPDDGLVIDMFLGSGSTMVAAHQLKRKCYGMELDPKYCDVIVKRMINLDPDLEIKRNGKVIDKAQFDTDNEQN